MCFSSEPLGKKQKIKNQINNENKRIIQNLKLNKNFEPLVTDGAVVLHVILVKRLKVPLSVHAFKLFGNEFHDWQAPL